MLPLNYAILNRYRVADPADVDMVMSALEPDYGRFRSFRRHLVIESLMTAKENGLLDESDYNVGDDGELHIYYTLTDYGKDILNKYIP
ncbi:MAG: hypothetical protein LBL36_01430 [Clostridiales Family XIII bacterium]|jgi:hypothetical protein|nr:hypothetical protein [Clostridiales Family XIII bacterium]